MNARSTLERPNANSAVLTAADRCDMCGARAWVRATMASGNLHFCAHHARNHIDALRLKALEVVDERHLLVED
ncbi:hypothetical protein I6B53_06840 [Schaalia sp. 19OD2882]|uniref:DUF7455 domain-containing protein n=1 Tax=Schaalia sp. 19OD2882 TaxID=2794089 RepID=UPI001C1EEBBE|nr:hypothetical protein [Schaalia sp. 19OD2882]QWW18867.1 hypothetical protein I6B53_06840 [Schaalia sp. 19OD2882]